VSGTLDGYTPTLTAPRGVAFSPSGDFFWVDSSNHLVRKQTCPPSASPTPSISPGSSSSSSLSPSLTATPTSTQTMTPSSSSRGGCAVTTLAGTASSGFLDGPAASALFSSPAGVAWNDLGSIAYIADYGNNRIRMLSSGIVSTIAGNGVGTWLDANLATAGSLSLPYGILVNQSGALIISDMANNRIRTLVGGALWTLAGSGSFSFADGLGPSASFYYPRGIALLPNGIICVADSK
jgi:DNA-binding beta-propeller fold protein YncE